MSSHRTEGVHWTTGNRKVLFPILSLGSGTDCPSRKFCAFSLLNYKRTGHRQCYAQVTERIYKNALNARRSNAAIIENCSISDAHALGQEVARDMCKKAKQKIIRLNEAGDLSDANILFACAFVMYCKSVGVKVYTYSKAPLRLIAMLRDAGAVVLRSQVDFVATKTKAEGQAKGLTLCPGTCGPCKRCPTGKPSFILEH